MWNSAFITANKRALELGVDLYNEPFYKQVLVTDIQFNTGKINKWKKVFIEKESVRVLYESRRHPEKLMDNRVYRLGFELGIVSSVEEAKRIGIEFAKGL